MQRLARLVTGTLAATMLIAACGASADSAVPGAQASPAEASSTPTSTSASSVASASTASAASSVSASNVASQASSSSSSSSTGIPAAAPILSAIVDLGAINFEPDVPTWPTISCPKTTYDFGDQNTGDAYTCTFYQSPTSLQYFGVGYMFLTKGDEGPYHAIEYCMCGGNGLDGGIDLGVAQGGTVSEALVWSGNIVVGYGDAADGATHALYWPSGAGSATLLPMPAGVDPHTHSEAHGINSAGEIVGIYWVANDPQRVGTRAVLWEPDAKAPDGSGYLAYDLSSMVPASAAGLVLSAAYAIDCTGDVASDGVPAVWQGDAQNAALHPHRYLVTRQGGNGATCSP